MGRAAEALKQDEPPSTPHYDAFEEQLLLLAIIERFVKLMLAAVNALLVTSFDLDEEMFEVDEATTRRLLHTAARRVVRIDHTTRVAIVAALQEGAARGYSNWQIAHGVPKDNFAGIDGLFRETWKSRAETIARTELQQVQRDAAVERYVASGLVDRVQVIDGCQWDTPCCERNGTIVPIERAPTLNHPNCTLLLVPLLREGIPPPAPPPEAVQEQLL